MAENLFYMNLYTLIQANIDKILIYLLGLHNYNLWGKGHYAQKAYFSKICCGIFYNIVLPDKFKQQKRERMLNTFPLGFRNLLQ